jgi:hypothetical protein
MAIVQFQEITQGGVNVSPTALSGFAGSILKPAAQPNGNVHIDNGWDTRRFRFMMEFSEQKGFGFGNKQLITGYTDYTGGNLSGAMDPNMRLYFNNSVTLRDTSVNGIVQSTMSSACHILNVQQPQNQTYGNVQLNALSMRPEDAIASMSARMVSGGDVYDFRTGFFGGPKKSKRSNAVAPNYVSRVMGGLHGSFGDPDKAFNKDAATMYTHAKNLIHDPNITRDAFITAISSRTNYMMDGFITYGELCAVFPNADHIAVTSFASQVRRSGMAMPTAGDSEYWSTTTTEAVIATTLSHSVTALMMDLMITQCVVIATNETLDGSVYVELRNPASFAEGIDMRPYMVALENRLRTEVLQDISMNNQVNFRIQMMADVIGDTRVTVSFASGPDIEFISPSFCDSLMAPVITNNQRDIAMIAADLDNLYNNAQPMAQTQPLYSPQFQMPQQAQQPAFEYGSAVPPPPPAY